MGEIDETTPTERFTIVPADKMDKDEVMSTASSRTRDTLYSSTLLKNARLHKSSSSFFTERQYYRKGDLVRVLANFTPKYGTYLKKDNILKLDVKMGPGWRASFVGTKDNLSIQENYDFLK